MKERAAEVRKEMIYTGANSSRFYGRTPPEKPKYKTSTFSWNVEKSYIINVDITKCK